MYPNFEEILEELSYKVGIVDLTNESHKQILVKLLRERGIDSAQKLADRASVVFEYIKEETKPDKSLAARSKDSGKLIYFGSKEAKADAIKAGTHTDPTQPTQQSQPKQGQKLSGSDFQTSAEKGTEPQTPTPQPKEQPTVDYDKLTADQKKKMVDAIVYKNNSEFDASENKAQFAIQTISARNEDINQAHILPPGTPGSSFAENNGAKYVNNFFNDGITKEKVDAAMEEMMKTPLAQKIQPESVRRAWAQVAVRTAVNEAQTLKNVPAYNAKNPQPEGLPQGAIMDKQNKAMVQKIIRI